MNRDKAAYTSLNVTRGAFQRWRSQGILNVVSRTPHWQRGYEADRALPTWMIRSGKISIYISTSLPRLSAI